jgi:hypothetical protein
VLGEIQPSRSDRRREPIGVRDQFLLGPILIR